MLVISNSTRGLNERYTAIIACAAAFTTASVLTLGMRVISKILMRVPLTSEDYTISLATVIYVVIEGLLIKGVTAGRHSTGVRDQPAMVLSRMVYIYSIFYFAAMALSIASILLTYRRIFVKPLMRRATTLLLIVTFCWWVPCVVIETGYFIVLPANIDGEPNTRMPFHLDYLKWWLTMGIIEQVILIVAVFLPIREVYALQLNLRKRLSVILVFAISYVCVGTGIARLATIYHPQRPGFDLGLGDIWISTHLGTAIMSASLPVCWPVVSRTGHALRGLFSKTPRTKQMNGPESPSRQVSQRLGPVRHDDSNLGTIAHARVARAVTKGGNTKHKTTAELPESADLGGLESEGSVNSDGVQQLARNVDEGRTVRRSLEARPLSWRFSLSGRASASPSPESQHE